MNSVKNFLMHSIQFIVCSENIGSEVENEVVRDRKRRKTTVIVVQGEKQEAIMSFLLWITWKNRIYQKE